MPYPLSSGWYPVTCFIQLFSSQVIDLNSSGHIAGELPSVVKADQFLFPQIYVLRFCCYEQKHIFPGPLSHPTYNNQQLTTENHQLNPASDSIISSNNSRNNHCQLSLGNNKSWTYCMGVATKYLPSSRSIRLNMHMTETSLTSRLQTMPMTFMKLLEPNRIIVYECDCLIYYHLRFRELVHRKWKTSLLGYEPSTEDRAMWAVLDARLFCPWND